MFSDGKVGIFFHCLPEFLVVPEPRQPVISSPHGGVFFKMAFTSTLSSSASPGVSF